MRSVKIIGTGMCLPSEVVTNEDLANRIDTSDQWIRERTGIRERRIADAATSTATLAAGSVRDACADAGIEPSELDGLIVGTCSPDTVLPSTACWVQGALEIRGMPAFDVMAGCSSFLYGLDVAANWLATGRAEKIAVCGAEVFSKIIDWNDRRTCVLFGDGAGTAIVTKGEGDAGILAAHWGCDGTAADILKVPAGGTRMPASQGTLDEGLHTVYMEGSKVFKHAVTAMSQGLTETLAEAGVEAGDVDMLIPHQANLRIMNATRERVGIGADRVYSVLEKYGNLSAASIPVALCEALRAGALREGQLLASTAFGSGVTWASALLRI